MGKKKLGGFTSLIFRLGDTSTAPTTTTTTKPNPSSSSSSSSSSWAWPSCKKQQRTDSLLGAVEESVVYKSTVNSAYLDSTDSSFLTHSSDNNSESFSTTSHDINNNVDDEESESLIRGLVRSSDHRLFVEAGGDTSSILEDQAHPKLGVDFKERSVAMAMESYDPYVDFKKSMEEMVAAHGLKDWECLEELLVWYLRVNGKKTHGYIVGAFVDLLVGLAAAAAADADDHHLLPSSCCGSNSPFNLSLSLSRNCNYEIQELLEDPSS